MKSRIQQKIRFLEDRLVSLDHYLPETYDYLMKQLDAQQVCLKDLEVTEHFAIIDYVDDALSLFGALEDI